MFEFLSAVSENLRKPGLLFYSIVCSFAVATALFKADQYVSHLQFANQTDLLIGSYNRRYHLNDIKMQSFLPFHFDPEQYSSQILIYMLNDSLGILAIASVLMLSLLIFKKLIVLMVFNMNEVPMTAAFVDKLWNFMFFRTLLIFGIMNVQDFDEITLWTCWFSLIAFLMYFSQLSEDRFDYIFSSTSKIVHLKFLFFLCFLTSLSMLTVHTAFILSLFVSYEHFRFMISESLVIYFATIRLSVKSLFNCYNKYIKNESNQSENDNDHNRKWIAYYFDLCMDLLIMFANFVFHLRVTIMCNSMFSVALFVVLLRLKTIVMDIKKRWKKHKAFRTILMHMETNYKEASFEELANADKCAICWDQMTKAIKLPCKHIFHRNCLQSWLEKETSCPTCRMELIKKPPTPTESNTANNQNERARSFFHFNGSRIFPWIPSFSIELTRGVIVQTNTLENNSIEAMASEIQTMFPQYALSDLIEDLQLTRSPELTINAILDGSLQQMNSFSDSIVDDDHSANAPSSQQSSVSATANTSSSSSTMTSSVAEPVASIASTSSADDLYPSKNESETIDGFSSSSKERELSLLQRKQNLIESARKKFLEKS